MLKSLRNLELNLPALGTSPNPLGHVGYHQCRVSAPGKASLSPGSETNQEQLCSERTETFMFIGDSQEGAMVDFMYYVSFMLNIRRQILAGTAEII